MLCFRMNEEGGYLGAMTYQCLYSGIFDKLRNNRRDDQAAQAAINVSHLVCFKNLVFQQMIH